MILVILGLILLAGLISYKKKVNNSTNIIVGMIFGLLSIVFLLAVSMIFLPGEESLKEETELVAFADNGVTSGSFFLGCGSIGTSFYYVFYEKKGPGIQYGKILAENNDVYIIEQDRDGGIIRRFHSRTKSSKTLELLFFPLPVEGMRESNTKTEIVIPTGSIKRMISLDLK